MPTHSRQVPKMKMTTGLHNWAKRNQVPLILESRELNLNVPGVSDICGLVVFYHRFWILFFSKGPLRLSVDKLYQMSYST
jgi:hypothetical protein